VIKLNDDDVMAQLRRSARPSVIDTSRIPIPMNNDPQPQDIVSKVRSLEHMARSSGPPQKVIDDIYKTYGVIVHPNLDREIVAIGGKPLVQGDIEYLKTTRYGYDHFIVYRALKVKEDKQDQMIDNVCRQFALYAPNKGKTLIRFFSSNHKIIAQLLGRERTLEGIQNKVVMPYEVVSLSSRYNQDKLHNETQLLYAIVAEIYKANVGVPYTSLSHYTLDPKDNPANGTGNGSVVPSSLKNVESITPGQLRRKKALFTRFFGR
jgi:hypothetical protein